MAYKTDLSNDQWAFIKDLFKKKPNQGRHTGRKRTHSDREIVNGIIYIVKTGCQWDMLPNDYPPKSTVFYFYKKWCLDGSWDKAMDRVTRLSRTQKGRAPQPTLGIIDSKSVQIANKCDEKGIDGGKKNQGKKETFRNRY